MDNLIKNNISLNLKQRVNIESAGGSWPLIPDQTETYAWMKDLFSSTELDSICNIGNELSLFKASTFGDAGDRVRNSEVNFIYPNQHTSWIFQRLADSINTINNGFFKFDLYGMNQGLQFTRYEAPSQHYDWHVDSGRDAGNRKLSLSLQLSDPDEYDGGELQLQFGADPVTIEKHRGLITFFPSYTLHRITPVTRGVRKSLVCWVSGPPFK